MSGELDEKAFPNHRFDGAEEVPSRTTDNSAPLDEKGHDPKLVAALRSLVKRLESTPEQLRGPFLVKGLKPYLSPVALPDELEVVAWSAIGVGQMAVDPKGRWISVRDFSQAHSIIAALRADRDSLQAALNGVRDNRDGLLEAAEAEVQRLTEENEALRRDAARYAYLREQELDAIHEGGVFAGLTPDNVVLNGVDLDQCIDAALKENAL